MRLENGLHNDLQKHEFAGWILKIGDRQIEGPNDGEVTIEIPE